MSFPMLTVQSSCLQHKGGSKGPGSTLNNTGMRLGGHSEKVLMAAPEDPSCSWLSPVPSNFLLVCKCPSAHSAYGSNGCTELNDVQVWAVMEPQSHGHGQGTPLGSKS